MRPTRTAALLTAGLVTLLGVPAAAAAGTPTALYVNNLDANCSDAGAGAQAAPFCTVSAAAKAVQPGQTVRIKGGRAYDEAVVIDRSGEPGRPIAFVGESDENFRAAELSKGLTISGAGHVVVHKLITRGGVRAARSADVELDRITSSRGRLESVVVDETSTDVRVTRSRLSGARIEGGSRGTVLSRNLIGGTSAPAVTVVDAPGTVVTNNSVAGYCAASLSVSGASAGSGLFNNVLFTESTSSQCTSAEPRAGISVSQTAAEGTRADYNLITGHAALVAAYNWSGTGYQTPAAFRAATGQGGHDILTASADGVNQTSGSPTVDSADPTAPGVLPTDIGGSPTADDPRVPNTGKDGGYLDRGAFETQDRLGKVSMVIDHPWAPVGTTVEVQAASDSLWPTAMAYEVDFGDGTAPVVTRQGDADHGTATHVYGSPCACTVKVTAVNGVGTRVSTEQQAKVTAAGPLTAAFTAEPVPATGDGHTDNPAPLTVRVDPAATATPWPVTGMDIDYGDGATEHSDHLSGTTHSYASPGEYEVTLTVHDSRNATSTANRSVKVDYAPSGYVAGAPFRLLDTRTTPTPVTSAPTAVDLPVGNRIPGHSLSSAMAAVVLNVTVTEAREDTHLTVWPSGQARPATSNVNVRAGGTSSNTVTVPVGADGRVQAALGSGQAALVVDFIGYYQPGAGQRFTPLTPTRLADTRTADGALGGGQTRTVKVAGVGGIPADATAVALNLTSTGATESAHVIAYPDPANRPATSNLNPEPGKDKSNQAIVPVGPDGTVTLYTNTGSTHLVLDAVGWYGKSGKALFTPAVPRRLADTRTTGKLAPGATTTVAGLPSGAVGAVLNVTATESTGPGFLTVYGYGTGRPEASSLNTRPGDTVPNHVTTPVADGRVTVWNSWGGSTHVITDLLGYFTQP